MRSLSVFCFAVLVKCVIRIASAAAVPLTFTINAATTNPANVNSGQTITFSTTLTASQKASNYTVGLQVFFNGTFIGNASTLEKGTAFAANLPLTKSSSWSVPSNASGGTYTFSRRLIRF